MEGNAETCFRVCNVHWRAHISPFNIPSPWVTIDWVCVCMCVCVCVFVLERLYRFSCMSAYTLACALRTVYVCLALAYKSGCYMLWVYISEWTDDATVLFVWVCVSVCGGFVYVCTFILVPAVLVYVCVCVCVCVRVCVCDSPEGCAACTHGSVGNESPLAPAVHYTK